MNMSKRFTTTYILLLMPFILSAALNGVIKDKRSNEGIPYAIIYVNTIDQHFTADENGYYSIDLKPGLYHIEFSSLGYHTYTVFDVNVISAYDTELNITLELKKTLIDSVVVQAKEFYRTREVPIGVLGASAYEIIHMPGATMDISKFVKTMPGVASKVAFGYNLAIRGSAPFENSYYIDGIEIPSISHFDVIGASGGPNGQINPMVIKSMNFYRGQMPVQYGNTLSGGIVLNAREGATDRWRGNFTIGATDFALVGEGPTSENSSIIISARESFSQHALKALGVPVVPTYYDAQLKWNWDINSSTSLSILGLASYDKYRLNLEAEKDAELLYNIGFIPEGNLFSTTMGLNLKHYESDGISEIILSHTYLRNDAWKYRYNDVENLKLLDFHLVNNTTTLRFNQSHFFQGRNIIRYGLDISKINYPYQYKKYLYSTAQEKLLHLDKDNVLNTWEYGAYASYSSWIIPEKLDYNLSLRIEGNTFNSASANVLKHISPRLATTYHFGPSWSISAMFGKYYQLPPSILLSANLDNRSNISYISNLQSSLGMRYVSSIGYQVTMTFYHKYYNNYPILSESLISFVNATSNYVAIGTQPAVSEGKGRTYGLAIQVKKEMTDYLSWQINYTYGRSEFTNNSDEYTQSIWDNRHNLNLVARITPGNEWYISARWFLCTGSPFTPYSFEATGVKKNWNYIYRGIFDYNRINEIRLPDFHALNLRVDKQFNFNKWSLGVYLDVQNVYSSKLLKIPYLTAVRTEDGFKTDPENPDRYALEELNSDTGRILPTIGVIIDI